MAKKKPTISPRKPPAGPGVDPGDAANFVAGASAPKRSDIQASGHSARNVITRQDGRQLKRTTVYLPPATAKKLAVKCAELDMELSTAMTQAIDAWLKTN